MYHPKLLSEMWWIGAESGKVMQILRISKPSPDPIYPAYVVGDSDNVGKTIQVAAITKPKFTPDQLEDLLRRLLASMAARCRRWKNCCSVWWLRHRVASRRL